ncbi:MAG: hypothetical protein C4518_11750 [Desulfobacteraceae bacterium]|nr:MAG: hypothetical protein C4518_11750 [Desulfobacteraceae bacterium]
MRLIFVLLLIPLFFAGCGGGGGSDNSDNSGSVTQAAVIDEASVTDEMKFIEESVPGCQVVEATEIVAGVMGWQPLRDPSGALARLFATLTAARNQTVDYLISIDLAPMEIQGDCGGSLTIGSSHLNGVTTFTLVFEDFCASDDTLSPPVQTKINGKLIARQVGTPSAGGPIISRYTAETDGKLTIASGTEKVSLTLDDFIYTLGAPGIEPGIPTQTSPDQVAMDQLVINFETRKRVMSLTNLRATSYESGDNTVLEMTSGRLSLGGKGYVDMSTSQPLVSSSDGDIVSGAVDFAGANGNVATVIAGDETGKFNVEINGEPMDQCMDCSGLGLDDIPLPL